MPKSRGRKGRRKPPVPAPKERARKLDPETLALLKRQREKFIAKFGREPGGGDPVFFDETADTPVAIDPDNVRAEVAAAMQKAGINAAIIYAYERTGLLLSSDHLDGYPPEVVREWDAAVQEYLRRDAANAEPADPRQWNTEIPELLAAPLSRYDHEQVQECMRAIDPILAKGASVSMRMEFAAAMVASACACAYNSAEAQGLAHEAPERYAIFEDLILRRARELAQGRA